MSYQIILGVYKVCLRNIGYAEKLVYLNLIAFSKNAEVGNNLEHKIFNETHSTLMVTVYLHRILYLVSLLFVSIL
jgi:hypothetical protein